MKNEKQFLMDRATILSALERDFDAAYARVVAAANAELPRLRASFSSAKAALEASARKNNMGTLIPLYGMGDVSRIKFEIHMFGKTWRDTRNPPVTR